MKSIKLIFGLLMLSIIMLFVLEFKNSVQGQEPDAILTKSETKGMYLVKLETSEFRYGVIYTEVWSSVSKEERAKALKGKTGTGDSKAYEKALKELSLKTKRIAIIRYYCSSKESAKIAIQDAQMGATTGWDKGSLTGIPLGDECYNLNGTLLVRKGDKIVQVSGDACTGDSGKKRAALESLALEILKRMESRKPSK